MDHDGLLDRRKVVFGLGGTLLIGGPIVGIPAYNKWRKAREQQEDIDALAKELASIAMRPTVDKAGTELNSLPRRARDKITTWFHAPCLNSAEFAFDICEEAFRERLARCETAELREAMILRAFERRVVTSNEILSRIEIIADEIGSELDRNWSRCCAEIASQWNIVLEHHSSKLITSNFETRLEKLIRESIRKALRESTSEKDKPALSLLVGEAKENLLSSMKLGKMALLLLFVRNLARLDLVDVATTLPIFFLNALEAFFKFYFGLVDNPVPDIQSAVSSRVARLAKEIGAQFETEMKIRIGQLHTWQDAALQSAAKLHAENSIG